MREMKDSGIEWIGEIPKDWERARLKDYFCFEKGKNAQIYTIEYIGRNEGIYPVYSGQTENNGVMGKINKYDYDVDECLFTTTVGAKAMTPKYLTGKFCLSQNCLIMQPTKDSSVKYFYYMLHPLFDYQKSNIPAYMQPSLRMEDLEKMVCCLPNLMNQKIIADFLDNQCSEIDATAEDIQKEISLLEDYKKSVITEAVTKGLNPDAEMKDSGIAWIGEIPKEWKIIRFKYVAIVKSNLVAPFRYMDYPQIAPDIIEKDTGNIISHRSVKEASVDSWNHLFYKGQILYSKIRPVLNKVTIAPYDGLCSADMYPISAKENVRFLQYIMLSAFFIKQVDLVTRDRIKMPKINQDELGNILLVVPSKEEQQQIADFLDAKCSEIDTIIADKKRQLDILDDYKKSLIYEYVTGKKEVPINE